MRAWVGTATGSSAAEAASALGWWLEAGVDVAVAETPRDWLERQRRAAPTPRQPSTRSVADRRRPRPCDLFRDWLASAPVLCRWPAPAPGASCRTGRKRRRSCCSPTCRRARMPPAGQPIGGEAWQLTERMLAAIGIRADDAYSASLSCFHAPGARMTRRGARRLRRDRPPAYRPRQAEAAAAARRRAGAGAARQAARRRARPCSQDRRGSRGSHLPPALPAQPPVGQGARLARPVAADGGRGLKRSPVRLCSRCSSLPAAGRSPSRTRSRRLPDPQPSRRRPAAPASNSSAAPIVAPPSARPSRTAAAARRS